MAGPVTWDPSEVCAAIQPQIVLEQKSLFATVEVKEGLTRRQTIVDWGGLLKKSANVRLIKKRCGLV